MKNPLLYLKEKEHQHAFYAVAIFIMLTTLFFLLVSLKSPVKEVEEVEPIEAVIEVSFAEPASAGSEAASQNNLTKEVVEDIAVQNEPSVTTQTAATNNVDQAFNFNPSSGTVDGPKFGDNEGNDIVDSGPAHAGISSRSMLKEPIFNTNLQEEGEIALKLWVDANGFVVKTLLDADHSNSGSQFLIREAIKAAKTMRYNSKEGAPSEFVGTKIFSFKKA